MGGMLGPGDAMLEPGSGEDLQSQQAQSAQQDQAKAAMQIISQISEQTAAVAEQFPEASAEFDLVVKALREAMIKIVSSRTTMEETAPSMGV